MAVCDNKSVGVIIKLENKFLIIERVNYPVAFACIAGHLDGDDFETAAKKEAREEGGIQVEEQEMRLQKIFQHPCKREGGSWHEWEVFEATEWSGKARASSDAKRVHWMALPELKELERKTAAFAKKHNVPIDDLAQLTPLTKTEEWSSSPGLEPVWVLILRELKIL